MKEYKKSATTYPMVFLMTDSADHLTGKTGLTVTVTISKNGAAFGAAAGAVSEIGNGWYKLAGHADDRDTLGPLALHATATGADDVDALYDVVSYDPYVYGANLDDTVSSRMAAASYVDHTAAIAAVQSTADDIETAVGVVKERTDNLPDDPASDTTVNSRLASSGYTAPDNASISAIKSKTDNLPADPASTTDVNTRLATSGYTAPDNAGVAAIKSKTDNLPDDPASTTDVNTRMASVDYVAPDNATIGAIDAAVTALAGVVDGIDTRVPADPASDTTVLTRLAAADYVAPANATILSIDSELDYMKGVVDGMDARLPVDPAGDTTMNARFDAVDTAIVDIPADTWAYTGVRALTTQNVSVVNDPVLSGFDSVYQHTLLMAIPCFWQREYTIPNGDTIDFTVYLRKNVSMAYLPRVWVFKTGTEPLIDGTYLLQEDIMPSDSIDTWEEMTLSYTNNTGVEDVFTIRILASNVGGSVFSQMETDYSIALMESSFGITVYPRDNSIYP